MGNLSPNYFTIDFFPLFHDLWPIFSTWHFPPFSFSFCCSTFNSFISYSFQSVYYWFHSKLNQSIGKLQRKWPREHFPKSRARWGHPGSKVGPPLSTTSNWRFNWNYVCLSASFTAGNIRCPIIALAKRRPNHNGRWWRHRHQETRVRFPPE